MMDGRSGIRSAPTWPLASRRAAGEKTLNASGVNATGVLRPLMDRLFGSDGSCTGCGQKIPASEMVYRVHATGTYTYHIKCFVCVTCRQPLQPGDRYGMVNGSLVCEQDYPKMTAASTKGQAHVPLPARTSHKVC
ncbi:hypothetical protein ACOMHN_035477 [Nucella lapillus]